MAIILCFQMWKCSLACKNVLKATVHYACQSWRMLHNIESQARLLEDVIIQASSTILHFRTGFTKNYFVVKTKPHLLHVKLKEPAKACSTGQEDICGSTGLLSTTKKGQRMQHVVSVHWYWEDGR
jgi:hypothetical protein